MHTLTLESDLTVSYLGPPLSLGPMPALFYFALSAKDSLTTDPYNQIVQALSPYPLRIFSMDLPAHEEGLPPTQAIRAWAQQIEAQEDPIRPFIQKGQRAIASLRSQGVIPPTQLAVAGLSRGAFIASHLAAEVPDAPFLLGFAPLTKLACVQEMHSLQHHPIVQSLELTSLIPKLQHKQIRFYIGNRDLRVGTAHCFHFVQALVDAAYAAQIRSVPIELILGPSIGHQGHGTAREVFEAGAAWIAKKLRVTS